MRDQPDDPAIAAAVGGSGHSVTERVTGNAEGYVLPFSTRRGTLPKGHEVYQLRGVPREMRGKERRHGGRDEEAGISQGRQPLDEGPGECPAPSRRGYVSPARHRRARQG